MESTVKCREGVCLHAEQIDKIYPGTKALDHVSFDVLAGKVNVLIGENGAGKSTSVSYTHLDVYKRQI